MGTIILIGMGILLGWVLFGRKTHHAGSTKKKMVQQPPLPGQSAGQARSYMVKKTGKPVSPLGQGQGGRENDHTLRNVAGGVVAGTILGHMVSGDHKSEAHETINNYNAYNVYNESDDDYDYAADDYDYDDYDSYDDSSDYNDDDFDNYDSDSSWEDDSYDDGDDW